MGRSPFRHDPHHMILKTQIPNYLPLLYLMMLPLGALPPLQRKIIWALCNLAFAAVSCMVGRTLLMAWGRV